MGICSLSNLRSGDGLVLEGTDGLDSEYNTHSASMIFTPQVHVPPSMDLGASSLHAEGDLLLVAILLQVVPRDLGGN